MPELDMPTLQLAKKLASRDNFSPAWIEYPAWAGSLPDTAVFLEKAAKYKTWAVEIRAGAVSPPPWLVEEWPDYQDETLNLPKPPKKQRPPHRFACTIQYTPTPRPDAAPRRWSKAREPSREEILELAIRLDDTKSIPRAWFSYPVWASYPRYRESIMEYIARLKEQAEAILRGLAVPPRWLLSREPWRWIRQRPVNIKTHPAPSTLDESIRRRLVRQSPLDLACALALLRRVIVSIAAWRAPPTGPPITTHRKDDPALCTREILLWRTVRSVDGSNATNNAAQLPHAAFSVCMRHAVDRAQLFVMRKAKAA